MTTTTFLRFAPMGWLLLLVAPLSAFAQDSPKAGLVMGVPAAISVIWRVTDDIAVRPEISLAGSSSRVSGSETDQTIVTPGISAIFYLRRWDAVRSYVSPRYTYRRATSTFSSASGSGESRTAAHDVAGSLGAEFTPHRRFGVFGEMGVNYIRTSNLTGIGTSHSWAVRTGVGAILYF